MAMITATQKPVNAEQEEVKLEDVVDVGEASQQYQNTDGSNGVAMPVLNADEIEALAMVQHHFEDGDVKGHVNSHIAVKSYTVREPEGLYVVLLFQSIDPVDGVLGSAISYI